MANFNFTVLENFIVFFVGFKKMKIPHYKYSDIKIFIDGR